MENVRELRPILKRRDRNPFLLGNRHLRRVPSPIAEGGEKVLDLMPKLKPEKQKLPKPVRMDLSRKLVNPKGGRYDRSQDF